MTQKLSCALKGTLATVNIFFVATGVITLFVGISAFLAVQMYNMLWAPGYFDQAIIFITTGAFILLVAIVGFYAVLRENYLLIMAYVTAMGMVLILHLAASISSFSIREVKLGGLPEDLAFSMDYYERESFVTEQWDLVQREFECCGTKSPNDWLPILSTQATLALPLTCCSRSLDTDCTVETAYTRGCSDPLVHFISSFFDAIGFGGLFLAFIQALMIVNVVSALWMVKVARQA